MLLRLRDIADITGGSLVGSDATVESVTIDSREVEPRALFVPIVAVRDGHDFIETARAAGAVAHLVTAGRAAPERLDGPAVIVEDTARALADLARRLRDDRVAELIGVTGSVGKTTTKDLLRASLGATRQVHASWRSFNNELGVPLTILNAPDGVDVVVAEMGARGVGHIARLCDIATPTIGVVLCVGAAHIELFGDIEAVGTAKGELVESLPSSGTAVLNAADPRVMAMAERTDASVITFGAGGDVAAERVALDDRMRPSFRLHSPWGTADVRLAGAGAHSVVNALAAVAATLVAGGELEAAVHALATAEVSPWRMEVIRTPAGALVVNDAYNANPVSMAAAVDALLAAPASRRVAVLGLMAELGPDTDLEHAAVGRRLAEAGVEVVSVAVEAYGGTVVADATAAISLLERMGVPAVGDAVLVKGSRVAGLERVAQALAAGAG